MMFSIAPLGFLFLSGFCFGQEFGYEGRNGPSNWGEDFHACIGKHQSPINIEEHNVKNVSLPPLKLNGIDNLYLFMTNNGHTVMLKTNDSRAAILSGGPLGDNIYVFEQLHFHWGENDHEGSEDLINNHSFSMEMHAVFYKEDYKSMEEALNHDDGLTVLAYFYEVGSQQNVAYEPIVAALPDVVAVGSKEKILQQPLLLGKLLIPNIATMQDYFTYNGSLTTPPCLEIVTWIDFKDHQRLSHDQLAAFRDVQNPEGNKLTHNFRPVQPLEDRVVFQNIPKEQSIPKTPDYHRFDGSSGQHNLKVPFTIVALGILFAVFLLAI
ncbi:carbonic anhydrase 2 [Linepithema humile]|uniref:carbonic anhydrase 2 n=1 Tax=Linepithema humile TaxID=83485 RepID=UPI0006235371|nr:PREDICTED: carbonic anhydrase 2 [Linepithema humile]